MNQVRDALGRKTMSWKDLSDEDKAYIRELRAEGWSLYDAVIQAECFATPKRDETQKEAGQ
jgi:hypothetical protein